MKLGSILAICLALGIPSCLAGGRLGIGLGFGGSSKPYNEALQKIKSMGISAIKTWSINPEWLDAVEQVYGGQAEITVAVPNGDLGKLVSDQGYVDWVISELRKHKGIVKLVAIGNEPYHEDNRGLAMPHLVNAFNRMVQALEQNGLQNDIKVTVPFSAVILADTYPPENTHFADGIIGQIQEMVPTMQRTGSKFSINLYPYFAYAFSSDIPLDLALGSRGSLFENMLKGCRAALDKIGGGSLPIIVGETGWPSDGGRDTTVETQQTYTNSILQFLSNSNLAEAIYIFEAFDESEKPGNAVERHFGVGDERRNLKFKFGDVSPGHGGEGAGSGSGSGGGSIESPCTEWGWKFYDQMDLLNADLGINIPAGDRNECQGLCRSTQGCQAYSWFQSVCYLKSGSGSLKSASEVYSAIIC